MYIILFNSNQLKNNILFCILFLTFTITSQVALSQEYSNLSPTLSEEEALRISKQKEAAGDKKEASRYLNHVVFQCWEQKNYDCAIQRFEESIKLNKEIDNRNGITMIYNNLGMIYADIKDYQTSVKYFEYTLQERKKNGDKVGTISALINLSVSLNNLNQFEKSANYLEQSLSLAIQRSDIDQMKSCYGLLAETYEKAGNREKASYYFELYKTFHEKVQKDKDFAAKMEIEKIKYQSKVIESEKRNKELEIELKNKELAYKDNSLLSKESQLKKAQDSNEILYSQKSKAELIAIAKQKENELQAAKIKEIEAKQERDRIFRNGLIITGILLMAMLLVLVLRYREKRKTNKILNTQNQAITKQQEEILSQRDEIVAQNEDITASIKYALRIQSAILANTEPIQKFLPQHFILWKPRDIVSGDFYWMAEKEEMLILAVADCTGHGVPGAFMSMIGESLLNQIVHDKEIHQADKILENLHKGIVKTLNQNDTQNKDGMDIALIVLDKQNKTLKFAGAHNPLYYFQEGQFFELKSNKKGIGGVFSGFVPVKEGFQLYTIDISKPTTFYLFSDGYQDQFGGEHNRKFMIKRFKNLLKEIHQKDMATQKLLLDQTIEEWKGTHSQIDDILVVGAKID